MSPMSANSTIVSKGESRVKPAGAPAHAESTRAPECCGQAMEPRLVHARNRFGETIFVAVWRCLVCNRIIH